MIPQIVQVNTSSQVLGNIGPPVPLFSQHGDPLFSHTGMQTYTDMLPLCQVWSLLPTGTPIATGGGGEGSRGPFTLLCCCRAGGSGVYRGQAQPSCLPGSGLEWRLTWWTSWRSSLTGIYLWLLGEREWLMDWLIIRSQLIHSWRPWVLGSL